MVVNLKNDFSKVREWTDGEISNWISEHNVLFMTNSMCRPGTMFLSSMMTYVQYVPVHNFTIINGLQNGKPYYGINVFGELTERTFKDIIYKKFDYAVYIDEDCFVSDFNGLMTQVVRFVEEDCWPCAGPMDGGMICHRNHSRILFNTYVSFWNMKMLRKSTTLEAVDRLMKDIMVTKDTYSNFRTHMAKNAPEVMKRMEDESAKMIEEGRKFRIRNFPKIGDVHITPYAATVADDESNPTERYQVPYSYKDNEKENFEPYYIIEELWIALTKRAPMYIFHADLYVEGETEADNSGLTSALYSIDGQIAVVHTWFSRFYLKFPFSAEQMKHTLRINGVMAKYGYV